MFPLATGQQISTDSLDSNNSKIQAGIFRDCLNIYIEDFPFKTRVGASNRDWCSRERIHSTLQLQKPLCIRQPQIWGFF